LLNAEGHPSGAEHHGTARTAPRVHYVSGQEISNARNANQMKRGSAATQKALSSGSDEGSVVHPRRHASRKFSRSNGPRN